MKNPETSAPWGLSSAFALAVVVAISPGGPTFAGCTWTWDGDHDPPGWHVHCSFQDDIFIEGTEGPGGSGGGGGCSNCVAMTSRECNAVKSNIIDRAETIFDTCNSAYGDLGDAKYNLDQVLQLAEQIKAEGDQFEYYGGLSAVPGALTGGGKWSYLLSSDVGPYLFYTQNHTQATNSAASVNALIQGANSIYNYYNGSVLPFVDDVILYVNTSRDYLTDAEVKIDEVQTDVLEIRNAASSMNCNACSGSGSGAGGGSGTPGDGGCPCAAYIQAVEASVVANGVTLSSILASVNLSKDTLAQILSKLTEIKTVLDNIKNDVYKIRQTTDLMDDFFKDDTEINFSRLIEHTLTLSNVVVDIPKLPPIKLYEDYTNATSFKMDDGTVRNWREWGATVNTPSGGYQIDFGEYANMNWFQRIEFLLGRLSDVFTPTNSAAVDFTKEQNDKVTQTETKFGDLTEEIEGYEEDINDLLDKFDKLRDYLNPFHDIFENLSPPSYITILPEVRVTGEKLVESIDPITLSLTDGEYSIKDLLDVARNVTTFIAWVFLLLLNVSLVVFLIRSLFFVISWFVKVYQSWSNTLFPK